MKTYYGHPTGTYITPTEMLHDVIEPLIGKLDKELNGGRHGETYKEAGEGGLYAMARAAEQYYPHSAGAIVRRLYDIRKKTTLATRVELAEALLMAVNINIEDTELPTLPAGRAAAVEMVEVYYELQGQTINKSDTLALADELTRFTKAFLVAPHHVKWEDAPEILLAISE